jgi:hypothetical protein
MTRGWEDIFSSVQVHKQPREMSDHSPLWLSTKLSLVSRKRDFRFEIFWLKTPECMKRIKEIWGHPTRDNKILDRVLFKLKKVKKILERDGL